MESYNLVMKNLSETNLPVGGMSVDRLERRYTKNVNLKVTRHSLLVAPFKSPRHFNVAV